MIKNKTDIDSFKEYNTISFFEILMVCAKQIKIIIVVPSIFCLIAIINVQYLLDPVYVSKSKIISSGSSGAGLSQASGLAAQFGITLPMGNTEINWVYPEIIKSSVIAKRVLSRKVTTEKYGKNKSLHEIFLGESILEYNKDKLDFLAMQSLLSMIEINEDKQTGIMTIEISSPSPSLSYQVNKTLIDELDNHQKNYNSLMTNKARLFIEERILQTEKELNLAEENLKNFRDRNRRIENSPGLLLDQQRLSREVAVLTGVFTTLKQQFETTKIEQLKDSDYVIIIDPPNIPVFYSTPNKRRYVIIAGIFGIGLGVILAFLKEFIGNKIIEEKENINTIKNLAFKNIKTFIPFISKRDK